MPINNQNLFFIMLSFITIFALLGKILLLAARCQMLAGNFFPISQNYFWHLIKIVYYALVAVPWWNGYHVSLTWMSRQFNSARDYQISAQQFRGETVITYPSHGWVGSSTLPGTTKEFPLKICFFLAIYHFIKSSISSPVAPFKNTSSNSLSALVSSAVLLFFLK